ncbi:MAG TPA: SIMPL domain-containing protein, partial [Pyrinomonadaceae bacterium]|nr:SIMPL domain-containing protein [Pyrinomonadaceae bacterium]
ALATRQAMIKAESIAQSLGGKIVRVVKTSEGGIASRTPVLDYSNASMSNSMMVAAKRSYITPVEAGSLDVRSQVLLVVEIEVKR